MKVKITRACKLYLTPDQTTPHTMGDVIEVESLEGIRGLVEVLEEEKPARKKTRKKKADPLDGDASNDDGTEDE